ncbi:hypothetical protein BH18THE2_BH18THE2_15350 [soil metagenome]
MNQKSIAIVAILAATVLTAVFTITLPYSMKHVDGQIIIPTPGRCPVGYERSPSGTCEPITTPPTGTLPTSENRTEQNIVCSGWSYTCG